MATNAWRGLSTKHAVQRREGSLIGSRSGVPVNMLGMTLSSLASNLTVFNLAARPPSSLPSVSRARPIREARPCCESPAILLQFTRPGKGYLAAAGALGPAPDDARTSLARERQGGSSISAVLDYAQTKVTDGSSSARPRLFWFRHSWTECEP